ncbi:MAG: hypothetical protein QOG64_2453 [Acidimicrobiaceae bacterium]|nr:hypothetical protein [Acidimicrobiaceae bacterium]
MRTPTVLVGAAVDDPSVHPVEVRSERDQRREGAEPGDERGGIGYCG